MINIINKCMTYVKRINVTMLILSVTIIYTAAVAHHAISSMASSMASSDKLEQINRTLEEIKLLEDNQRNETNKLLEKYKNSVDDIHRHYSAERLRDKARASFHAEVPRTASRTDGAIANVLPDRPAQSQGVTPNQCCSDFDKLAYQCVLTTNQLFWLQQWVTEQRALSD